MTSAPELVHGALVAWNDQRGFGFITPSTGGSDVFIHISAFPPGSARPLVGELLSVEMVLSDTGKRQAGRVVSSRPKEFAPWRRRRSPSKHGPIGYLTIPAFIGLYLVIYSMSPIPAWVAVVYVVASVMAFVAYGVDKSAAVNRRWRVSESVLLTFGLLGGWPGAILGQTTFRHKTRKLRFQQAFWGTVALNVVAFVVFVTYR